MPHLNETIDLFLTEAMIHNLPITFSNLAFALHAFDLFDSSAVSRETIRKILAFLRFYLVST